MENKDRYSPTYISDNFPLDMLECQYFDICKAFNQEHCHYNSPCEAYLILKSEDKQVKLSIREALANSLENFIGQENLKFQVGLIVRPPKDHPEEQ